MISRHLNKSAVEQASLRVTPWHRIMHRNDNLNNSHDKLREYMDDYHSGLYTRDETNGRILDILAASVDFDDLWPALPEWTRSDIWTFLQRCDETTVLYNFSSQTMNLIDPNLIALKTWLVQQQG